MGFQTASKLLWSGLRRLLGSEFQTVGLGTAEAKERQPKVLVSQSQRTRGTVSCSYLL